LTPGTIVTENVGSRPSTGVALPPKYEPKTSQSDEEATDPLIADHRNFYKVEKWTTKDGSKVDHGA